MENENSSEHTFEFRYTDNAKKRLEELQKEYAKRLEFHLKRRKFKKGNNFIEITSSDLDNVASKYQYVRHTSDGLSLKSLYIVFVIGIVTTSLGIFWNDIANMLSERNPDGSKGAAISLLSGLIMVIFSISFYYYKKLYDREKKKEREQKVLNK